VTARAVGCSAQITRLMTAVVGVMPVGSTRAPSNALTKVDLP
jgi:hypothetical protein